MACVSRGELGPKALQDLLSVFVQARGAAYANDLAELSMRFFSGLVELSTDYSHELIEAIAPGGMTTPRPAPPQLDASNWSDWLQQLTDYASQQGAEAVGAYQAVLDRVAAGELPPAHLQQASTDYLERGLPEHLRHLFGLCFGLLEGLNDVRTSYDEEYLAGVLATATRPSEATLFALDLVAPLGEQASASLSLANTKEQSSVIRCMVTDVRRSDGIGPAFAPRVTITPEQRELGPGEETSLVLSILLAEDDYEVGPLYVGDLHVTGHGDARLDVPLRIRAVAAAEGAPEAGDTPIANNRD